MACHALAPDGAFLSGMLGYVDCQAQAIGQGGYQALATSGSSVSLMLTGLLTVFVALFGYRLVLGDTPSVRDGAMAAAKLGMVLVLATSWPAFRVLAYDVVMHGPAELAASVGDAASLPGANGGLVGALQQVDNQLIELIAVGSGKPAGVDVIGMATLGASPPQPQSMPQVQLPSAPPALAQASGLPRWDPQRDVALLAEGRTLYLGGAIGAFASVRLVAGLLLALGPLFALFLLFRETRGLFEGWMRALAGAALGAAATAVLLGVQVALMRPWLDAILAERRDGTSTPAVPAELLVVSLVFALALFAALAAMARVAASLRLPDGWRASTARSDARMIADERTTAPLPGARMAIAGQRSRALVIADGVAALQRREIPQATSFSGRDPGGSTPTITGPVAPSAAMPLGQAGRRRTRGRVSASAMRRDVGA